MLIISAQKIQRTKKEATESSKWRRKKQRMKPRRRFWPNPAADSDQTQAPEASSFLHRRGGDSDQTQAPIWPNPGAWSFIVFASSRRRDTSDLCVLHRLKLSPAGFGQNRRLGLHRLKFLSSSFWTLWVAGNSHHYVAKSSPLGSVSMNENRVQ